MIDVERRRSAIGYTGRGLVIGASGFFGGRLLALLGDRGVGTFRGHGFAEGIGFDATRQRIGSVLDACEFAFDHAFIPFGTIDMEGCARDPAGTAAVNVVAVLQVLHDLIERGVKPVFVSTDYVFDGDRALWREDDRASPRMSYGAQKLAVEAWLGTRQEPWLVVRLSKVVSGRRDVHGQIGQWVNEIIAGKPQTCAADQFYSPGFVDDLASATLRLAQTGARGLFHVAGPERFSRLQLLGLLAEEIERVRPGVVPPITPGRLHDMPFLEKRPLDTSLCIDKLLAATDWRFTSMGELCRETAAQHFG